jgi:hypothetical protein
VFSIYTHSTLFILFSLLFLVGMATDGTGYEDAFGWFGGLVVLSVPVYFVLSLRRVYRQGWLLTILKSICLFALYSLFLALLTAGIFVVSFVTF